LSLEAQATATANSISGLSGQYTVKIDNGGYVSGFGLASTAAVNGTPASEFYVRADRFAVGYPGNTKVIPFVVTSGETINGVNVPAGVYMDAAYIKNGTITNAKIGDGAIDNAKIANLSAAKINAGTIDAARLNSDIITSKALYSDTGVMKEAIIQGAHIVNATIGSAKIADGAITNAKIGNAEISGAKIASATITGAKIANATIGDAQINTISAGKISASSLSSITANLGTITAGRAQNASGTNFIDFDASGGSSFIKVGNSVDIKADGTAYFSNTVISRQLVVAEGVYTVGYVGIGGMNTYGSEQYTQLQDALTVVGFDNEMYTNIYGPVTWTINTGVPINTWFLNDATYIAEVNLQGSVAVNSYLATTAAWAVTSEHILVNRFDGNSYIAIRAKLLVTPSVWYMNNVTLVWKLYKVT
jgi:hypothetical protein